MTCFWHLGRGSPSIRGPCIWGVPNNQFDRILGPGLGFGV